MIERFQQSSYPLDSSSFAHHKSSQIMADACLFIAPGIVPFFLYPQKAGCHFLFEWFRPRPKYCVWFENGQWREAYEKQ